MTETAGPDKVASAEQIGLSAREAAALPPRDAANWARKVDRLQVDPRDGSAAPTSPGAGSPARCRASARCGRRPTGWTPGRRSRREEAIATWREHFPEFWPNGNRFAGALTGINPGDVALLDLAIGGGVKLSTGVFVLYADAESFTLMTPQGHMFAGWITFSAERDGETTIVQAQVLMRANDPLYEVAMTLGGHRKEDKFWAATLTELGQRLGVDDPQVETRSTCVDSRRQWRHVRQRLAQLHGAQRAADPRRPGDRPRRLMRVERR